MYCSGIGRRKSCEFLKSATSISKGCIPDSATSSVNELERGICDDPFLRRVGR